MWVWMEMIWGGLIIDGEAGTMLYNMRRKQKRREIFERVEIGEIVPTGQGIGELADGRKAFVWGALPGETVEARLTKVKKSYAEGVASEIIEASPRRVEPRDECYMATSPWQIMDYDYELAAKAEIVRKAFRLQNVEVEKPEVVTDFNEWHYRNKMEYSLYWDNDIFSGRGGISLAQHARGSHRKVPIGQSSIERSEIFAEASRIIDELNARGEEARRYQALIMRCNQGGEVSGGLLENGKPHPVLAELRDTILDREYSYSPNGFFQINLPVYEMALLAIREALAGWDGRMVDMYSGVGTIGLSVANGREVTLVESNAAAAREASRNSEGMANARVVLAKSEEALEYITGDVCATLDPPRAGLDARVVARILEVLPPRVVYLSCNPITQARDVAMLLSAYKIALVKAFNFFPKTPHVENLVVLERE
ncbi:TRAM domain-containing protein [Candidatus Saccharibacteria bacterium]|nr:TRAM domain-containing protein [Candidatus Saccharibacteria bacterium]